MKERYPDISDVGTVCEYRQSGIVGDRVPVLILAVSILEHWVDIMTPSGHIQSVSPWQCKKI